jgi:hypothetical protein
VSRTPTADDWQALYGEAILESDPAKIRGMIDLAYKVIQRRAFELWYLGAPLNWERHELDTALYILDLLKNVGPVQDGESPAEGSTSQKRL